MAKYLLLFSLFFVALSPLTAQDTSTPAGTWQTIDDDTGEAKSLVEIYEQNGKYYGRIAKILTDNKGAICDKCTGKQKNQPIEGLVIIKNLEKDGDEWNGGTILDPQKGSEYRLVVWYEDDADKLFIRGKHWTGLYRTQTWVRKKS